MSDRSHCKLMSIVLSRRNDTQLFRSQDFSRKIRTLEMSYNNPSVDKIFIFICPSTGYLLIASKKNTRYVFSD